MNTTGMTAYVRVLVIACGLVAGIGGAGAQEATLLAVEGRGLLPLEGERTLALEGLPGTIGVRIGKPGEIRFVSVAREDRELEIPLEVWQDGRTIRVRMPAEAGVDAIRFEATVPSGIGVVAVDSGPELSLMNIDGDIDVTGTGLDVQAVGIGGGLRFDLTDGAIRVDGVAGGIDVEGVRVNGSIARSQGGAILGLRESRIVLDGLTGDADLEADESEVRLAQVRGQARVNARGGRIELDSVDGGGRIRLEGSPLTLKAVKGDVEIETDGDIGFENCAADLHINSYGGSVRGIGNDGLLEVKTDGASVEVEDVKKETRVEGDSLDVRLTQIGGDVQVFTTSSELVFENFSASARVESEYGDVTATGIAGKLEMVSRDGNVRVSAQNGPVLLEADGDVVEVGWVSLNWNEDSRIENERGDVTILIPGQGGCTLSAEAKYGGVESELDDIEVSGDGGSASGVIRRQARPRLDVVAEGSVRILRAPGADSAGE
jgi:DUF4097 and DUF4098 domain-containing protein YvlB